MSGTCDLIIRNGRVLDGTGAPAVEADVLVRGKRIMDIGHYPEARGAVELDARGLTVSPGFIDAHTHLGFILPHARRQQILEKWVRQGVTTIVAGNCGFSPAPVTPETTDFLTTYWDCALPRDGLEMTWRDMGSFLKVLCETGQVLNVAMFTGHNVLRYNAMGCRAGFAGEKEILAMQQSLETSLAEGSIGLSVGLYYLPGTFAHTSEISSLAAVFKDSGKPLAVHTRGLSQTYDLAVEEMIGVAEEHQVPLQLSHHAGGHSLPVKLMTVYGPGTRAAFWALRCLGKTAFKKIVAGTNFVRKRTDGVINRARERGVTIGCDNMPWLCGPTSILALLPPLLFAGGTAQGLNRLKSPDMRRRVEKEIRTVKPRWPNWEHGYWTDNFLSFSARLSGFRRQDNLCLENLSLKEIAEIRRTDPFTAFFDLILEEQGRLFIMDGLYDDPAGDLIIEDYLTDPHCSIMTDVIGADYESPNPVPYGAFAKVLGYLARDKKRMTQAEAVRKMTSLPARQMGLQDRGELKKGAFADLCIFNPETICHRASFQHPHRFAQGVEYVAVNGRIVLDQGKYLPETFAGQVITA